MLYRHLGPDSACAILDRVAQQQPVVVEDETEGVALMRSFFTGTAG